MPTHPLTPPLVAFGAARGGWKSTMFSGEGLVVELSVPGKGHLQSRSQDSFLAWLIPRLSKQTSGSSSGD